MVLYKICYYSLKQERYKTRFSKIFLLTQLTLTYLYQHLQPFYSYRYYKGFCCIIGNNNMKDLRDLRVGTERVVGNDNL